MTLRDVPASGPRTSVGGSTSKLAFWRRGLHLALISLFAALNFHEARGKEQGNEHDDESQQHNANGQNHNDSDSEDHSGDSTFPPTSIPLTGDTTTNEMDFYKYAQSLPTEDEQRDFLLKTLQSRIFWIRDKTRDLEKEKVLDDEEDGHRFAGVTGDFQEDTESLGKGSYDNSELVPVEEIDALNPDHLQLLADFQKMTHQWDGYPVGCSWCVIPYKKLWKICSARPLLQEDHDYLSEMNAGTGHASSRSRRKESSSKEADSDKATGSDGESTNNPGLHSTKMNNGYVWFIHFSEIEDVIVKSIFMPEDGAGLSIVYGAIYLCPDVFLDMVVRTLVSYTAQGHVDAIFLKGVGQLIRMAMFSLASICFSTICLASSADVRGQGGREEENRRKAFTVNFFSDLDSIPVEIIGRQLYREPHFNRVYQDSVKEGRQIAGRGTGPPRMKNYQAFELLSYKDLFNYFMPRRMALMNTHRRRRFFVICDMLQFMLDKFSVGEEKQRELRKRMLSEFESSWEYRSGLGEKIEEVKKLREVGAQSPETAGGQETPIYEKIKLETEERNKKGEAAFDKSGDTDADSSMQPANTQSCLPDDVSVIVLTDSWQGIRRAQLTWQPTIGGRCRKKKNPSGGFQNTDSDDNEPPRLIFIWNGMGDKRESERIEDSDYFGKGGMYHGGQDDDPRVYMDEKERRLKSGEVKETREEYEERKKREGEANSAGTNERSKSGDDSEMNEKANSAAGSFSFLPRVTNFNQIPSVFKKESEKLYGGATVYKWKESADNIGMRLIRFEEICRVLRKKVDLMEGRLTVEENENAGNDHADKPGSVSFESLESSLPTHLKSNEWLRDEATGYSRFCGQSKNSVFSLGIILDAKFGLVKTKYAILTRDTAFITQNSFGEKVMGQDLFGSTTSRSEKSANSDSADDYSGKNGLIARLSVLANQLENEMFDQEDLKGNSAKRTTNTCSYAEYGAMKKESKDENSDSENKESPCLEGSHIFAISLVDKFNSNSLRIRLHDFLQSHDPIHMKYAASAEYFSTKTRREQCTAGSRVVAYLMLFENGRLDLLPLFEKAVDMADRMPREYVDFLLKEGAYRELGNGLELESSESGEAGEDSKEAVTNSDDTKSDDDAESEDVRSFRKVNARVMRTLLQMEEKGVNQEVGDWKTAKQRLIWKLWKEEFHEETSATEAEGHGNFRGKTQVNTESESDLYPDRSLFSGLISLRDPYAMVISILQSMWKPDYWRNLEYVDDEILSGVRDDRETEAYLESDRQRGSVTKTSSSSNQNLLIDVNLRDWDFDCVGGPEADLLGPFSGDKINERIEKTKEDVEENSKTIPKTNQGLERTQCGALKDLDGCEKDQADGFPILMTGGTDILNEVRTGADAFLVRMWGWEKDEKDSKSDKLKSSKAQNSTSPEGSFPKVNPKRNTLREILHWELQPREAVLVGFTSGFIDNTQTANVKDEDAIEAKGIVEHVEESVGSSAPNDNSSGAKLLASMHDGERELYYNYRPAVKYGGVYPDLAIPSPLNEHFLPEVLKDRKWNGDDGVVVGSTESVTGMGVQKTEKMPTVSSPPTHANFETPESCSWKGNGSASSDSTAKAGDLPEWYPGVSFSRRSLTGKRKNETSTNKRSSSLSRHIQGSRRNSGITFSERNVDFLGPLERAAVLGLGGHEVGPGNTTKEKGPRNGKNGVKLKKCAADSQSTQILRIPTVTEKAQTTKKNTDRLVTATSSTNNDKDYKVVFSFLDFPGPVRELFGNTLVFSFEIISYVSSQGPNAFLRPPSYVYQKRKLTNQDKLQYLKEYFPEDYDKHLEKVEREKEEWSEKQKFSPDSIPVTLPSDRLIDWWKYFGAAPARRGGDAMVLLNFADLFDLEVLDNHLKSMGCGGIDFDDYRSDIERGLAGGYGYGVGNRFEEEVQQPDSLDQLDASWKSIEPISTDTVKVEDEEGNAFWLANPKNEANRKFFRGSNFKGSVKAQSPESKSKISKSTKTNKSKTAVTYVPQTLESIVPNPLPEEGFRGGFFRMVDTGPMVPGQMQFKAEGREDEKILIGKSSPDPQALFQNPLLLSPPEGSPRIEVGGKVVGPKGTSDEKNTEVAATPRSPIPTLLQLLSKDPLDYTIPEADQLDLLAQEDNFTDGYAGEHNPLFECHERSFSVEDGARNIKEWVVDGNKKNLKKSKTENKKKSQKSFPGDPNNFVEVVDYLISLSPSSPQDTIDLTKPVELFERLTETQRNYLFDKFHPLVSDFEKIQLKRTIRHAYSHRNPVFLSDSEKRGKFSFFGREFTFRKQTCPGRPPVKMFLSYPWLHRTIAGHVGEWLVGKKNEKIGGGNGSKDVTHSRKGRGFWRRAASAGNDLVGRKKRGSANAVAKKNVFRIGIINEMQEGPEKERMTMGRYTNVSHSVKQYNSVWNGIRMNPRVAFFGEVIRQYVKSSRIIGFLKEKVMVGRSDSSETKKHFRELLTFGDVLDGLNPGVTIKTWKPGNSNASVAGESDIDSDNQRMPRMNLRISDQIKNAGVLLNRMKRLAKGEIQEDKFNVHDNLKDKLENIKNINNEKTTSLPPSTVSALLPDMLQSDFYVSVHWRRGDASLGPTHGRLLQSEAMGSPRQLADLLNRRFIEMWKDRIRRFLSAVKRYGAKIATDEKAKESGPNHNDDSHVTVTPAQLQTFKSEVLQVSSGTKETSNWSCLYPFIKVCVQTDETNPKILEELRAWGLYHGFVVYFLIDFFNVGTEIPRFFAGNVDRNALTRMHLGDGKRDVSADAGKPGDSESDSQTSELIPTSTLTEKMRITLRDWLIRGPAMAEDLRNRYRFQKWAVRRRLQNKGKKAIARRKAARFGRQYFDKKSDNTKNTRDVDPVNQVTVSQGTVSQHQVDQSEDSDLPPPTVLPLSFGPALLSLVQSGDIYALLIEMYVSCNAVEFYGWGNNPLKGEASVPSLLINEIRSHWCGKSVNKWLRDASIDETAMRYFT